MSANSRALHYVFRIANRRASYDFYIKTLGMKVLRHEEFEEKCQASCNGPYDGMWSKTMVGYGSEDEHFVLELTYNYGVHSYQLGNDFHGIYIESNEVQKMVQAKVETAGQLTDPDGHSFFVSGGTAKFPVTKVALNVTDLAKSQEFWGNLCAMEVESASDKNCVLSYGKDQCKLELRSLKGVKLDRGTAFGRIAFATPTSELKNIEEGMKAASPDYVVTPLKSLDTPGKATVWVVILQDPNDHEICFVGDEAFKELSTVDANAEKILLEAIEKDKSDEWK